jgi:hypothetical protein
VGKKVRDIPESLRISKAKIKKGERRTLIESIYEVEC